MPSKHALARRFAILALPLALAAGLAPGEAARADIVRMAQAPSEGDVGGFSQGQLEAYANAVLTVQEIDEAWSPRIAQAPTKAEAETLTAQATDEMIGGIEAEGLSVQEYNAITQAAQRDERLYERIMTLLAHAK
ncbi:MAG: hypothetical protein Kow00114_29690 [Kiloniellaceae bacterium]